MIPITCSQCGGASQIDAAWLGQWVQCPHCGKPTQAAATKATPPAENTPAKPQAATEEPAEAPAPLTRQQRLAMRRRLHLVLAIGGGVLLVATAYVLFLLSR